MAITAMARQLNNQGATMSHAVFWCRDVFASNHPFHPQMAPIEKLSPASADNANPIAQIELVSVAMFRALSFVCHFPLPSFYRDPKNLLIPNDNLPNPLNTNLIRN